MRLPSFLITAPLLCTVAIADPAHQPPHNQLDAFVNAERAIALQGALNNIGPNGSAVPGAGAGYVVASPSKENPNYFYTWSRDSALTLKMLIDEFIFGNRSLLPVIEDYIHAQAVLQTVSNPSGPFLPQGVGLGEPKFLVDGTRFNGAWGRPQRDGPALRATALMSYSSWLIKEGKMSEAKNIIWPIISNDLSYVGQYWNQTGFDLWEETDGSSFFTLQNQYRALVEGAQLAKILHVTCTGCNQAPELLCFLQSFWNGAHIVSNINVNNGRTGLDANSILGSIAVFDIDADCDSLTWQPCHSQSLANFKVLTDTFRALYDINKNISEGQGAAIGRYPEDVYMGGNPWYLITTAAAEFLYDAVAQWKARGSVIVDSTSMAFFKDIYPKVAARQYNSRDAGFAQIMNAVTAYADSYVTVAQKYIPTDGSLSEQFDRETGAPTSAIDLTWSYAAFVTMAQRRAGQYPASWGSRTAVAPPATCSGTSKQGVYAPATAAGAPNVTSSCQILAQFNVNATTYFGENIYIVGNTTDLGAWDLDNSYPLSAGFYTSERPLWNGSVYLTAGETINYKYARQEDCNQPWIYETENRTLVIPPCGGASITTDDAWIGPVGTSGNC